MKRKIDIWNYAGEILRAVPRGVLLTTKAGDKVNTMTIGWGTLGTEWATPIFTVFVRESRFTKGLLDRNPEFTINVPYGTFDKSILGLCGTKSGRDMDKIQAAGLTLETPEVISVPGVREFPLTLECRVIYKQDQDPEAITEKHIQRFYPEDADGSRPRTKGDYHTAYYGEVVAAYIIE